MKPLEYFKKFKNRLLADKGHFFTCSLPEHTGMITGLVYKALFTKTRLDEKQKEKISSLGDSGIIVYINKYASRLDMILFLSRFRHEGLPYPTIGFDYRFIFLQPLGKLIKIFYAHSHHTLKYFKRLDPYKSGFIANSLAAGSTGLLSLIDEKSFYKRFVHYSTDSIEYLIQTQKGQEKPVYLVPQLIIFNSAPDRDSSSILNFIFGTRENPGAFRKIFMLMKSPGKIFFETGEPVNLKEFLRLPDINGLATSQQALLLRRSLIEQINTHRQSITGPILKDREELKESILTSDGLQEFMAEEAHEQNKPLRTIHKKAAGYIDEIASNYNMNHIRVFEMALSWMFKNIFDGTVVDIDGLDRIKEASRKGPLVLVPCHKSHLDYLLLSYIFHKNNMPCPHIAAGKNLSFWPMGYIFRGGGAFFIRRTFKGNKIYSRVFSAYVEKLLKEGFNLEFFIEGGRSRTGKLLSPKLGMLSIILKTFRKRLYPDLHFVPIFIGYDRVLEEGAYLSEIEGGAKNPENLSQMIKARKFLKKKYGKVYINFDQPLSLKEYLKESGISRVNLTGDTLRSVSRNLGQRFISSINDIAIVTPHGVVAAAILNGFGKTLSRSALDSHIETYLNYLVFLGVEMTDTLQMDAQHAVEQAIENYEDRKFIERIKTEYDTQGNEVSYLLVEDRRPGLDYYKNNCINFFAPAAFTALAILEIESFQFEASDLHLTVGRLQDLFREEFSFNEETPSQHHVRKIIKAFINEGILVPHKVLPDTYNITSPGLKKLKLFSAFLKPYLESYKVVMSCLMKKRPDINNKKDTVKAIQSHGQKMFKNREIELSESLSGINFSNGLSRFSSMGIFNPGDEGKARLLYEVIIKDLKLLS